MNAILRYDLDGLLRVQLTEDPDGAILALDEMSEGQRWSISILPKPPAKEVWLHQVASLPEALRLFASQLESEGVQ